MWNRSSTIFLQILLSVLLFWCLTIHNTRVCYLTHQWEMHLLLWYRKYTIYHIKYTLFNSLWPSDAMWRQRSGSTLAQVMACCLTAITWTNVDWSSVKSSDIHIRAISQEMLQPSITKICLKITYLKFHSNFPGANELIVLCFVVVVLSFLVLNCDLFTRILQDYFKGI